MSLFNQDQEDYMRELAAIPRNELCHCGWYRLGKCPNGPCVRALEAAQAESERKPATAGEMIQRWGEPIPDDVHKAVDAAVAAFEPKAAREHKD